MQEREHLKNYESNYAVLPFEDILRGYRQQNIFDVLSKHPHRKILEIGCGPQPLFQDFNDFELMVVVEPAENFYREAVALAGDDKRIRVINSFFENVVNDLEPTGFDFIVIGGFLHEIDNPGEVLRQVRKLCSPTTIVHSFVPNANSFHRLMAFEMGLIKDVYQQSGHDKLFQRVQVFDMESFKSLFLENGFSIDSFGTYFIKPFTHGQMIEILDSKLIDKTVIDGLNKMIKYFPDHGAEMYINGVKLNG